jgi:hypothetical protein
MNSNTMTSYRAILGLLLLPALQLFAGRKRKASKTSTQRLPKGSVAPLY